MVSHDSSDFLMKSLTHIRWNGNYLNDDELSCASFVRKVNKKIDELNDLIKQYNGTSIAIEQREILKQIEASNVALNTNYNGKYIQANSDFRKQIHIQLFNEIQQQKKNLGLEGLSTASNVKEQCCDLLANMAPERLSSFISVLNKSKKIAARDLMKLFKKEDADYHTVKTLLNNNSIEFVGGFNSKNFKLTPMDGTEPFIIKIENRMGMPKSAEMHLRSSPDLADVFTPAYVQRPCIINDGNKKVLRSIVVTDFCTGGDLQSLCIPNKNETDEDRLEGVIKIYLQMATIIKTMEQNNCAFPDMKNSNWLLDSSGTVRLADTKAFVFTQDGKMTAEIQERQGFGCISTPYMNPKELNFFINEKTTEISADKLHSFMLGKNIYHYLSNAKASSREGFGTKNNGRSFDYTNPIFTTDLGRSLKHLIEELVRPDAATRITMDMALDSLISIKAELQANKVRIHSHNTNLLDDLNGVVDLSVMSQLRDKYSTTSSLHELRQMKSEVDAQVSLTQEYLDAVIKELSDDEVIDRKQMKNIRAESSLVRKKQMINAALPIESRTQFNDFVSEYRPLCLSEKKACQEILDKINELKFGANDLKMQTYINEKQEQLNKNKYLYTNMRTMRSELEVQYQVMAAENKIVHGLIDSLKNKANWSSFGITKKIEAIESAMSKLSIEQRIDLHQGRHAQELRDSLALHRGWFSAKTLPAAQAEKRVTTFQNFKLEMEQLKAAAAEEVTCPEIKYPKS